MSQLKQYEVVTRFSVLSSVAIMFFSDIHIQRSCIICTYVHAYIYVCMVTHVCLYVCMHVHIRTYICSCTYNVHIHNFVCTYVYTCTHTHTCFCMCASPRFLRLYDLRFGMYIHLVRLVYTTVWWSWLCRSPVYAYDVYT